jgi:hypothetical protein
MSVLQSLTSLGEKLRILERSPFYTMNGKRIPFTKDLVNSLLQAHNPMNIPNIRPQASLFGIDTHPFIHNAAPVWRGEILDLYQLSFAQHLEGGSMSIWGSPLPPQTILTAEVLVAVTNANTISLLALSPPSTKYSAVPSYSAELNHTDFSETAGDEVVMEQRPGHSARIIGTIY